MKIVFNIQRLSWYRMLSPIVDAALMRGHIVECWHDMSTDSLKDNKPLKSKVPNFRNGKPRIVEYTSPESLIHKLNDADVDVVVDIRPPENNYITDARDRKFLFAVLAIHGDFPICINNNEQLKICDVIFQSTRWYVDKTVEMVGVDYKDLHLEVDNCLTGFGELHRANFKAEIQKLRRYKWRKKDIEFYEKNAITVGFPPFDVINNIDKKSIRQKWNIPDNKKVVVLLPCPYDVKSGMFFGDFFMANNFLKKIFCLMEYREFNKTNNILNNICDKKVVKAIRAFCDKNNAVLLVKLRHSRNISRYLKNAADIIVADECFYPHSAQAAFSIADLTIGYYSTGVLEAVAAGSSYINVQLPFFPEDTYFRNFVPIQDYVMENEGVVWSFDAKSFIDQFHNHSLGDFVQDKSKREVYLEKYAGDIEAGSSNIILDSLEKRLDKN